MDAIVGGLVAVVVFLLIMWGLEGYVTRMRRHARERDDASPRET